MFRIGTLVKLDWNKGIGKLQNDELRLAENDYDEREDILKEWDKKHGGVHVITDKESSKYTNETPCYELDYKYWFDEDEVIEVENENNDNRADAILEELRGWLIQGMHCIDDTYYEEGSIEKIRITEKINTMSMVVGKIDELKRSM